MKLCTLSVGTALEHPYQSGMVSSAILKHPTLEPLKLTHLGLVGDQQVDTKHHGGPDKAVCVYALEHYMFWAERLGRELPVAAFGENFTVMGLTEEQVCIGDVYRVGTATVQVTQPRQPCFKLAMRHGIKDFAVQVEETGFTGFYLRVLQEGTVQTGDPFELVQKGEIPVQEVNRILHHDKKDSVGIGRLVQDPFVADALKKQLAKRL